MKRKKSILILGICVIVIFASLFAIDQKEPDCADAACYVPPALNYSVAAFNYDPSSGVDQSGPLPGCWHYCAIAGVWGIDNGPDDGLVARPTGVGACLDGKRTWEFRILGSQLNAGYLLCFRLT